MNEWVDGMDGMNGWMDDCSHTSEKRSTVVKKLVGMGGNAGRQELF